MDATTTRHEYRANEQPMSKEMENTRTPRLRFAEFREAWTKKTLGGIAVLINDKAGINRYKLMSITAGIGLVSQIEKFGREIAGESYKNYYVIKKGDFAYNKSSTKQYPEGQIAVLENEETGAVPNSIFTCFRIDDKLISPFFLKYPFENNIHGNWLKKFIEVGARAHGALSVDTKDLFAIPIFFPSLAEQQKIAACLSSLDELISAQSEKIKALQRHKKGLMQQLFPADGETAPRRRFGEFEGEWQRMKLGECLLRKPDYGVNAPAVPYSKDLPTYLRITDISEGGHFLRNQMVSVVKGVTEEYYLSEDDIVLARTGASVGKSYKYRVTDGRLVFAGFLIRVKPNPKKINSELLFQFFSTEKYWRWVAFISARSGQPGINGTEYSSMPIILPPTLAE